MSIELYRRVYSEARHRKDHYGRNSVLKLKISTVSLLSDKNYLDMCVHERINVRAGFRGLYHPTACIKQRIMHDRYPFLLYEGVDIFKIAASTKNVKLYKEKKYL